MKAPQREEEKTYQKLIKSIAKLVDANVAFIAF